MWSSWVPWSTCCVEKQQIVSYVPSPQSIDWSGGAQHVNQFSLFMHKRLKVIHCTDPGDYFWKSEGHCSCICHLLERKLLGCILCPRCKADMHQRFNTAGQLFNRCNWCWIHWDNCQDIALSGKRSACCHLWFLLMAWTIGGLLKIEIVHSNLNEVVHLLVWQML